MQGGLISSMARLYQCSTMVQNWKTVTQLLSKFYGETGPLNMISLKQNIFRKKHHDHVFFH